jgi:alpha-glucosidase
VTPETLVTAVYVNMLAGPLDMDNGIFDLLRVRSNDYFKAFNRPAVPSTITSEAARTLIVFSGLTVLPDIPEDYEKFPALLLFITSEKMPWRKSKTLMGQIGKYIVMARQATDGTWLVGAATDSSPRVLNIPLSFLGKGKYQATIIRDGEHADYLTNRAACQVNKETVKASGHVEVRLAPGGGACMIIKGQ